MARSQRTGSHDQTVIMRKRVKKRERITIRIKIKTGTALILAPFRTVSGTPGSLCDASFFTPPTLTYKQTHKLPYEPIFFQMAPAKFLRYS